jgi:hypothetical protein
MGLTPLVLLRSRLDEQFSDQGFLARSADRNLWAPYLRHRPPAFPSDMSVRSAAIEPVATRSRCGPPHKLAKGNASAEHRTAV